MSCSEYEEYLKAYYEQQRLEKYQRERALPRPKTTKLTVALHIVILLALILGFILILFAVFQLNMWLKVLLSAVHVICMAESYGRMLAVKIVECYQHYASEEKRRRCWCVPSCSEYAILCLKKYELVYALLKIKKRLFVTCKGFDYIIDEP